MKKVIGLCLVVLLSSTSVFARENRRMDKRKMDPSARCEKMIADLKLDEKQAVEFWYQVEPHAKFPALPSKDDLEIPRW